MKNMNEDFDCLALNQNFYWFQQNTNNIYKLALNESDWVMMQNNDNFVVKEMFRVCITGPDEALLTGNNTII